jgi:hypothetical protein
LGGALGEVTQAFFKICRLTFQGDQTLGAHLSLVSLLRLDGGYLSPDQVQGMPKLFGDQPGL